MRPKVSVIVPVYNAGHYFEKCLQSLVNQTLKELEIIVVLDCPTDGSDKVAERFAASDSRIKLIYNARNLFAGSSRNKGMEQATGEYIGFCDHDDYCAPAMYELLYRKAKSEDFDIACCNFMRCTGEQTVKDTYLDHIPSEQLKEKSIRDVLSIAGRTGVIWNQLFKTSWLNRWHIRFINSECCAEDRLFFVSSYCRADKVGAVSDCLYYHLYHLNNAGATYSYCAMKNVLVNLEYLQSFLKETALYDRYQQEYMIGVARFLYTVFRRSLRQLPFKEMLAELRLMKQNKTVREYINALFKLKNFAVLWRIKPTAVAFLGLVKWIM
jgi:glycosyltransferase involved in cell wall biosynthesis